MRNTKQREAIIEVLKNGDHLSAEDIYSKVNENMKVDLSTVYRNLNIMYNNGKIVKVTTSDGVNKFCLSIKHHSHLICLKCNKIYEIPCCLSDELHEICNKMEFDDREHNINVYGYCKECSKKIKGKD